MGSGPPYQDLSKVGQFPTEQNLSNVAQWPALASGVIVPPGTPKSRYLWSNQDGTNNSSLDDTDPIGTLSDLATFENLVAAGGDRPTHVANDTVIPGAAWDFNGSQIMQTAVYGAGIVEPLIYAFVFKPTIDQAAFVGHLYHCDGATAAEHAFLWRDASEVDAVYGGLTLTSLAAKTLQNQYSKVIIKWAGASTVVRINGTEYTPIVSADVLDQFTLGGRGDLQAGSKSRSRWKEFLIYDTEPSLDSLDTHFDNSFGAGWPKL